MKLFRRRKEPEIKPDAEAGVSADNAAGVGSEQTSTDPAPASAPTAAPDASADASAKATPPTAPVAEVPAEAPAAAAAAEPPATAQEPAEKLGFYARLKRGLSRTSSSFAAGLGDLFLGKKAIDDDLLEDLEAQLLMADLGVDATQRVIDDLTRRVSRKELADTQALTDALQASLLDIISPCEVPLEPVGRKPFVILVVGVNGAGKTTTIGKLAHRYQAEGRSVMLAAGDTFRAAAVEQLQVWGDRNNVPVIAQHTGADSASVLFDALQAATAREADVLIADTAGRLQNKAHLMDELAKVVRVLRKFDPSAPHEVLLVLDAGTGQNAVSQAEQFNEAVGVTGVVLTKLDGTARGGVIFAIAQRLARPIRFIGVGEGAADLRPFVARDFVRALFDRGD